jgi:hypothetical protein
MNPSVMALQLGVIHLPNENTVADTRSGHLRGFWGKFWSEEKSARHRFRRFWRDIMITFYRVLNTTRVVWQNLRPKL